MKSKAYAAKSVNDVAVENLVKGREGQPVVVGVDVGKFELRVVARWGDQQFERSWRHTHKQHLQALLERFDQFAQRVRNRLDSADAALRRDLIRALVKRVEVGADSVRIVYRIDLHPFDPGPTGGHLRHWVWCHDTSTPIPKEIRVSSSHEMVRLAS